MFLSMNWISDFVDLSGLDKLELINKFSLSTAEVPDEIFPPLRPMDKFSSCSDVSFRSALHDTDNSYTPALHT